jgi:hypothetical protein
VVRDAGNGIFARCLALEEIADVVGHLFQMLGRTHAP